jgi:hypothetical protein
VIGPQSPFSAGALTDGPPPRGAEGAGVSRSAGDEATDDDGESDTTAADGEDPTPVAPEPLTSHRDAKRGSPTTTTAARRSPRGGSR